MDLTGLWQGFTDTGDPICYLMVKKLEREAPKREKKKEPGEEPRPED